MPKPRKSSPASGSSRPTTTTQRWRSSVSVLPLLRARGGRSRSAKWPATHERTALQKRLERFAPGLSTNPKRQRGRPSLTLRVSVSRPNVICSNEKERKMAESSRSAKRTTKKTAKKVGFTDEERAAMKEYLQEKKAAAGRGPRADKADGERAVLATIAAMSEADRAMSERRHGSLKARTPALSP